MLRPVKAQTEPRRSYGGRPAFVLFGQHNLICQADVGVIEMDRIGFEFGCLR